MLINYFKIAIRNLLRYKLNSILNIFGLALSLSSSFLILLFIREELQYDRHFLNADRIFRLTNENLGDDARHWAVVSPLHALEIQDAIPEIETAGRLFIIYPTVMKHDSGENNIIQFEEKHGFYADSSITEIFDIQLLQGDYETALCEPNTVLLSVSTARRYFGDRDPVGMSLHDENRNIDLKVTGVFPDLPATCHMNFDFLVSMATLYQVSEVSGFADWMQSRGWAHFYTYLLVNENADIKEVNAKIPDFTASFYRDWGSREEVLASTRLHLQPLTDIHLHSHYEQEMQPNGHIAYILLFGAVALFILIIAAVNFINIAMAQAFRRMRETGVRKVLGADRRQLLIQYQLEYLITVLIALILAVIILELLMPVYSGLVGRSFPFAHLLRGQNFPLALLLIFSLSLLSGMYPALFIAGFKPINTLKGTRDPRSSVAVIRRGLVMFQFIISIFMIFCTLVTWQQMHFFQSRNLGFNQEMLMAVELYGPLRREIAVNPMPIKNTLINHSAIVDATVISTLPGDRFSVEDLRPEGTPEDEDLPSMRYLRVDQDFLKTFDIQLLEGRNFTEGDPDKRAFLINKKAQDVLQRENLVGSYATNFRGTRAEIVGVIQNFNFASLHQDIEPLVVELRPEWGNYLILRIHKGRIKETIGFVRETMAGFAPDQLFRFQFLDEKLDLLYHAELRMNRIFQVFAVLAIFISCLGLFGLSAYFAELRTKEIGIRKVLGSSISDVLILLTKDFTRWILAANLVAWPLAWWTMSRWLENFAYHIRIQWWFFLLAGAIALVTSLITVGSQAFRAGIRNPIQALRYE